MPDRAAQLIAQLQLQPHPEGGHFREVFRAPSHVRPDDGRGQRSALTTIYFLLQAGEVSRLHRVASDEVWHFYEGAPLELWWTEAAFTGVAHKRLGPWGQDTAPVAVVPAGCWQAARSTGAYTLVGCTVAPGFDFSDFTLLVDDEQAVRGLRERQPQMQPLL